ncbi:LuxR C-terminal-related transcriptional regulator [Streptomyces longwoodensis]|uniref:AAA family ATPase n=1 Tax=Streptomyces longwoodensis TaxID=68231 RepID=UPI002ED3F38B|nr:LuxR C-terminal-related transcriptional regulator [Streptomyces longwoodensis]
MLWEREAATAAAEAALRRAARGRGSLLLVEGALGAGKSAFLDSLGPLSDRHGALLLAAHASQTEEGFECGVVRQLADACPPAGPRWPSDSFGALVDSAAPGRPLVITVDDLHWCDASSVRGLLRVLAPGVPGGVVLVVSVLSGHVRAGRPRLRAVLARATSTVRLSSLGPRSVRALTEAAYGTPVEESFVRALHTASGGSPLVVHGLLDDAVHRGLEPTGAHAPAVAALRPERVRQRLDSYLGTQPADVSRAAHALAVLGTAADPPLLDALASLTGPARARAVASLRRSGLVGSDGSVFGAGTVAREMLAEAIPADQRPELHGAAADLLYRAGYPAETAAEHLMAVPTLHGGRTVVLLRAAADGALHRGSPRSAARYLRRALVNVPSAGPERAGLLVDLATAERSFAPAASLRHVVEALPLLRDARERAAALARLGPLHLDPAAFRVRATFPRLIHDLRRCPPAGRASPISDDVDRDLLLRLRARAYVLSTDDRDACGMLPAVRGLGPDPATRTPGEREMAASLIHHALVTNSAPAHRLAALAARLLHREPAAPDRIHTVLPLALHVLAATGHPGDAAAWLRAAAPAAARQGAEAELVVIRATQALVTLAAGRPGRARREAHEIQAVAEGAEEDLPPVCLAAVALIALDTEEPERAERLLARHPLHAEDPQLTALLHAARGALSARGGDPRTALHRFRTAGRVLEHIGWRNPVTLPWSGCAALMHHRLGEDEEAVAAARQDVERARAFGAPLPLGRALGVLGRVTAGRAGAERLEESVTVLERGSSPYELSRALYALGGRPEADPAHRLAVCRRALELAVDCGAPWLADRVRRRLDSTRATTTASSADSLTPSERRVARLAASGLSNSAISLRLGISSRMVERHLTQSYRKLDIPGKTHLTYALEGVRPEHTE